MAQASFSTGPRSHLLLHIGKRSCPKSEPHGWSESIELPTRGCSECRLDLLDHGAEFAHQQFCVSLHFAARVRHGDYGILLALIKSFWEVDYRRLNA